MPDSGSRCSIRFLLSLSVYWRRNWATQCSSRRASTCFIMFSLRMGVVYDCNKVHTLAPGAVTSPNYPAEYPNDVSCTTHLMAPEGQVVYFNFKAMNVEAHPSCIYDYVTLYNGPDQNASTLVGRYCGSNVPTTMFQSTGRDMFIMFSSDGSVTNTGFKADFNFDIAREPTSDPDIAVINSLESELSAFKFGIAAACIFGALLIMVVSASLYTVTQRDAMNAAKLADIEGAVDAKPGYHTLDDDEEGDDPYTAITDTRNANGITKVTDSQGTQATKAGIVAETGHGYAAVKANGDVTSYVVNDEVDSGAAVNKGFVEDEGLAEEAAAAVAAFDAAVVDSNEGMLEDKEEDNSGYQNIVVAADISPLPKENTEEEAFPHPPLLGETDSMPPPPEETPPPPPPPETETSTPKDNNEDNSAL
eukprot:XP_011669559.1 PREDICTED: uncharacterized protein LOC577075 [Strongylocentrotus purpuratus]